MDNSTKAIGNLDRKYEVGDWIFNYSDKIIKLTSETLFYFEEIKRKALPEEIPEFEVDGVEFDSLTKENFFDRCMLHCPIACKLFCDWIDEYKKIDWDIQGRKMNWDVIFGNNTPTQQKIKFHDIPFEMQFGILLDFFSDKIGFCSFGFQFSNWQERDTVVAEIIDLFVALEVGHRNNWSTI